MRKSCHGSSLRQTTRHVITTSGQSIWSLICRVVHRTCVRLDRGMVADQFPPIREVSAGQTLVGIKPCKLYTYARRTAMSMLAERLMSGMQASTSEQSTGLAVTRNSGRPSVAGTLSARQPITAHHTPARTLAKVTRRWRSDHLIGVQLGDRSASVGVLPSTPRRRCPEADATRSQRMKAAASMAERQTPRQLSVPCRSARPCMPVAMATADGTAHPWERPEWQHSRRARRAWTCR